MKRTIYILIALLVLASCGKKSSSHSDSESNVGSQNSSSCLNDLFETIEEPSLADVAQMSYVALNKCQARKSKVIEFVNNIQGVRYEN